MAPAGMATRRPNPVSLSAGVYIGMMWVCYVGAGITSVLAAQPRTREMAAAVPIAPFVMGIMMLVLAYKMWSSIDDGATQPTPGKAVGFLFIPLFSIYWVFVVWPGFATKYNAFVQRNAIQTQPIGQGIYIGALLLGWIPIVGPVLWSIAIAQTCRAVNALNPAQRRS